MTKDEEHRRFHPEGHHEFGCPQCEARAAEELVANQMREAEAMRRNVAVEVPSVEQLVGALPEDPDDLVALIAHANAALPVYDSRKITREKIAQHIRRPAEAAIADHTGAEEWDWVKDALQFADALESLLPPPIYCRECGSEGFEKDARNGFCSRSCEMAYHDRENAE
jgi:hypothetical protein